MFRRNISVSAIALAEVIAMVSAICFTSLPAVALSRNLLFNSEFRDGGEGWDLGEFGVLDGKVTREGYP